jgi:hypothetical protein
MTDKPNFILVNSSEIAKDPTHRLDPKYWIRKKRHNAENLVLAKNLAKHLILHRLWHILSQRKIAIEDLNVTPQQYSKLENCQNDAFYVQVARIFKNRGWSTEILGSNPYEVLIEWLKRDYNINNIPNYTGIYPDKYYKILDAWKLLDLKAEKNYYKK